MFGLRAEIERNPLRRRVGIGNDQHFRGTRHQVYAHIAGYLALGFSDPCASGTRDQVNPGYMFSAKGQCGNGLCATKPPETVHIRKVGGRKQQGIVDRLGNGRSDDNLFDTSDACGDGGHEKRRGVGRLTAWHIDADSRQGNKLPHHEIAKFVLVLYGTGSKRRLVKLSYPRRRGAQHLLGGCIEETKGTRLRITRHFELAHLAHMRRIEAASELK